MDRHFQGTVMRFMFFVSVFWFIVVSAQDDLFNKGLAAYQKEHYQSAYDAWMNIEHKSAAVWFNLGNAAAKLTKFPDATVYWLRAGFLARGSLQKSSFALAEHSAQAQGYSISWPEYFWITRMSEHIPLIVWQIAALVIVLLGWVFFDRLARQRRWYTIGTMITIAMVIGTGLLLHYHAHWYTHAIVLKDQVSLYAGPDEQFDHITTLAQGSIVTVMGSSQGWYTVAYNGYYGWAVQTTMAIIDEK